MSQGRSCVFCGGRPVTDQHVFRGDLRAAFSNEDSYRRVPYTGPEKVVRAPMFEIRVKRVCQTCNQGWMDELERPAAKLIRRLIDGDCELDRDEVQQLRRWITLVAMMRSFAEKDHAVHEDDLERFYRTGSTPFAWNIYMMRGVDHDALQDSLFYFTGDVFPAGDDGKLLANSKAEPYRCLFHAVGYGTVIFMTVGLYGSVEVVQRARAQLEAVLPPSSALTRIAPWPQPLSWSPDRPIVAPETVSATLQAVRVIADKFA